MHYTICQIDNEWFVLNAHGDRVGAGHGNYHAALLALGTVISDETRAAVAIAPPADPEAGLLSEPWRSEQGIAFSRETAGGRNFAECDWSWRDPATALLPVMFQTKNLPAHYEADLAGFITELSGGGVGKVEAKGRFYDNDAGRAARDVLAGDRRFGVSVDPTENVDFEENFVCVAWDDEGFCVDGDFTMKFLAYEIGGFTLEPHPCFEEATIVLDVERPAEQPVTVAASGNVSTSGGTMTIGTDLTVLNASSARASLSIPTAPPRAWFDLPEPRIGEPFLQTLGDEYLVEQGDSGAVACPMQILSTGQLFGHINYWGQCHTASPWGPGVCASAQPSRNGYADFHAGCVHCDDGTELATGLLHVGCEHSTAMDVRGVRDAAAHAGLAFAQVRAMDGEHGIWIRGALLPTVTDAQATTLRALTLSGEWVPELGAIIAVNEGGLPLQRSTKIAASNGDVLPVANPVLRASMKRGQLERLVGGNLVRRCPECQKRAAAQRGERTLGVELRAALARQAAVLDTIERRTRHLIPVEAQATVTAVRARLGNGASWAS